MHERDAAIDKLDNYDKHYVAYSDNKLSSACRQLAFAEGAVFWAFKEVSNLSLGIAIGFLILVFYFACDTLQYYFGMRDYEKIAKKTRGDLSDSSDLKKSEENLKKVKLGDTNKRLEKCLKWKLIFISTASIWLILVFIKIFLICCRA